MNAQEIIQLLEEPTNNRWPMMDRITAEAPLAELVAALQEKPAPFTRQLLCDILGKRYADPEIGSAIPVLVEALQDPSSGVRGSAGEPPRYPGDAGARHRHKSAQVEACKRIPQSALRCRHNCVRQRRGTLPHLPGPGGADTLELPRSGSGPGKRGGAVGGIQKGARRP
jgi:hypothetical protein